MDKIYIFVGEKDNSPMSQRVDHEKTKEHRYLQSKNNSIENTIIKQIKV
jgi:hypothetical protein